MTRPLDHRSPAQDSGMTNNRVAVAASFVAGAMLVAVAVVTMGGPTPGAELSLAQKKAMLKASVKIAHGSYGAILSDRARRYSKAATAHMQSLNQVIFGMTTMGDTGLEEGNQGQNWNFMSANFEGHKDKSLTQHHGGVGMYGHWGVDEGLGAVTHKGEVKTCVDHGSIEAQGDCSPGFVTGCSVDTGCHPIQATDFAPSLGNGICDDTELLGNMDLTCYCKEQQDCADPCDDWSASAREACR